MKFKACKRGHKLRTWGDTFGCGRLITNKAGSNRWRLAHGRFVKASKMFKVPFESSTSILASGGIYRPTWESLLGHFLLRQWRRCN